MAYLTLTAANLVDRLEVHAGWSTPTVAQSAQALQWLNDGYRRFLRGAYRDEEGRMHQHQFSFMRPWGTLQLWTTATGTMSVVTVTITAGAATFYPEMVGATLTADTSGNEYTITAYTSSTVVTVNTSAAADDGDTFTITATGDCCLPADFGGLIEAPVYTYSTSSDSQIQESTPEAIQDYRRTHSATGTADTYAIAAKTFDSSVGQRYVMMFAPVPSADRTVKYRYRVKATALTDAAVYPLGGEDHIPTLLACAKAEADLDLKRTGSPWEAAAMEALRESVNIDTVSYDSKPQISLVEGVD